VEIAKPNHPIIPAIRYYNGKFVLMFPLKCTIAKLEDIEECNRGSHKDTRMKRGGEGVVSPPDQVTLFH
jgi:hypothetical protein